MENLKAQYPEGCQVYLKSGSPPLTVEWVRADGLMAVVWFNGQALCRDALHPNAITATPI
jgi:uncharacterized protein YodC (DUF2158 family)